MEKVARRIIISLGSGLEVARAISGEFPGTPVLTLAEADGGIGDVDEIIYVGALGTCVRKILPQVMADKHTDPAVVCVDTTGRFVIPVLSGHVGGANDLARRIARRLGATPVITTRSDNEGLWALDTLASDFGWACDATAAEMNRAVISFVGGTPTALFADVCCEGVERLKASLPTNVKVIGSPEEAEGFGLVICVSPLLHGFPVPALRFYPPVLTMGVGCRRDCPARDARAIVDSRLTESGLSPLAVGAVATIELKKDERLVADMARGRRLDIFRAPDLEEIEVPNPSEKVREVTGVWGVAESCAIAAADGGPLLVEKRKEKPAEGADFTFAVALRHDAVASGHIEIVGAGPGDPELVSVRGKRFLSQADLILYAGSLVPVELTHYAKPGCTVRSSADMSLEEQFALMREFYDRGCLVVRLHTGDPCIYGAIQEQMAYFDRYGMSYHITPGISSFQAAAAELRSQFTIPEKVQTIILTRGEGRTPMPEKEQLHKLARSQSTMCIYLSASIAAKVQAELLEAYPPETPVAVCHKLTWKEQKIVRGRLDRLAGIVAENRFTLTTLIVVGEAIDNRQGLSRLYDAGFTHMYRKGK